MSGINEVLGRYQFLTDDLTSVQSVIRESLSTGNGNMDKALARFSDAPGKMLRPSFIMLSARFGPDFDPERMHRLAAAVELLHIASLVHDDIIDESPTRRGVPTLHTTEGTRKAVLLGDFLFTRCFGLVSDFASPDSARLLAAAVGRICESEMAQASDTGLSRRAYLRKIAGKTALLFSLSLSVGAKECGADEGIISTLRTAGYGVGMSFQVVDDILDYGGNSGQMGKPTGRDLSSGLKTLPLILAMETGNPDVARLAAKFSTRRRVRRLSCSVQASGGLDMARDMAEYYNLRVQDSLGSLPENPAREALIDLSDSIARRKQ